MPVISYTFVLRLATESLGFTSICRVFPEISLTNIIILLRTNFRKELTIIYQQLGQPIKYINFQLFSNKMKSENNSPNVFEGIYLSTSKHLQPQSTNCPQQPLLFKNKLQTIAQFLQILENQEEHSRQIQLQWQKSFFKNELKAALFLNYSLVKLQSESMAQISKLKQAINTFSTPHSQLKKCQKAIQFQLSPDKRVDERYNSSTPSKGRSIKQAFEAQKKILNVRHVREREQVKKSLQHAQCMLRASKEQNEYLRSQLIKLTQKLKNLQKSKKQLQENKLASEKEIVRLSKTIQDFNEKQRKWNQQKRFTQLNCSPIRNQNVLDEDKQGQISFNNQFFTESLAIENKLLKKQLQQIQLQFQYYQKQVTSKLQEPPKAQEKKEHNQVLVQSRRLFLVALENQYLEIKQELEKKVKQIERHKQIISETKRISENCLVELKKENSNLKQTIQQMRKKQDESSHGIVEKQQIVSTPNCPNCTIFAEKYNILQRQCNLVQQKNYKLREKIDKTLKIQILQRKQWDIFLKDFQIDVQKQ